MLILNEKIMKKLIMIVVCMLSVFSLSAQKKVTWGMEVGAGLSGWMGQHSDGSKPLFNPKVGVTIDIPISGFVSFQTGLNWVSKGASYKMLNNIIPDNNSLSKVRVNQNYFQMPLLAAVHLGTTANFDLVITGGPYIAYGASGKSETDIDAFTLSWKTFDDLYLNGEYISDGFNRFDAGIQLGLGLDFPSWTLGLDGDFSFCKVAPGSSPYNFAMFLTLGYKF